MTAWVEGRVAGRRRWSDSLHSLLVHAPEVTFIAGQFARLALPGPPDAKEAAFEELIISAVRHEMGFEEICTWFRTRIKHRGGA